MQDLRRPRARAGGRSVVPGLERWGNSGGTQGSSTRVVSRTNSCTAGGVVDCATAAKPQAVVSARRWDGGGLRLPTVQRSSDRRRRTRPLSNRQMGPVSRRGRRRSAPAPRFPRASTSRRTPRGAAIRGVPGPAGSRPTATCDRVPSGTRQSARIPANRADPSIALFRIVVVCWWPWDISTVPTGITRSVRKGPERCRLGAGARAHRHSPGNPSRRRGKIPAFVLRASARQAS